MNDSDLDFPMRDRFRSFLPVVIDVETGGFNSQTDALLEIAVMTLRMDENGFLFPNAMFSTHVKPFEGANLEPASLEITGIDPFHPLRAARDEKEALEYIFKPIRKAIKANNCTRGILVGHNAAFDLGFINAAVERTGAKRNPLHPFSTFDTVSLGALAVGQTVLAKACRASGIDWNDNDAHSAVYDTERTAELFCTVINRWRAMELTCGGKARKLIPPM